jgi:hypothetical protein
LKQLNEKAKANVEIRFNLVASIEHFLIGKPLCSSRLDSQNQINANEKYLCNT